MTNKDILEFLHKKGLVKSTKLVSDTKVYGISDDSRNIHDGFIFVAIKGLRSDGNDYIEKAVSDGAIMIVSESDIPQNMNPKVSYIQVVNARKSLALLASYWYGNPSDKLKVIGVTGTKGKTTTVYLIYHIMKSLRFKVGMVSTNQAEIDNKVFDTGSHVTNPDPITLNKLLSAMVKSGCKYAILEVSSHGIDQERIAGIQFEVTVLTNIYPEHLDYHKNFENYEQVKMRFVKSGKHKVISPKKTNLNILPGEFNNLNVEAALKAVSYFGISKNKAFATLKTFKLPEGRMEEMREDQPYRVVIDFAHTPDSLEKALTYLRKGTQGRLISVFGCAGERDRQKRPLMGEISADLADISIFTLEDPRSENVNSIINSISEGALKSKAKEFTIRNYKSALQELDNKAGKSIFIRIPDRKKAIEFAITKVAQKGDTVAFFGKGHEKTMNTDGIHETPWSDTEVVREYIKKTI